jgi:hypothetical protein
MCNIFHNALSFYPCEGKLYPHNIPNLNFFLFKRYSGKDAASVRLRKCKSYKSYITSQKTYNFHTS